MKRIWDLVVSPAHSHLVWNIPPHLPQSPLPWIKGLKWGEYVGSPSAPDPVVCFSQPHGERFGSLLALPTRAICGLSRSFCLMMIYSKEQGEEESRRASGLKPQHPPDASLSLLLRCPQHAQHRHPVVGHLELGLRRQHPEAEEQAERAAHQLYSVFTAPPGKQKLRIIKITDYISWIIS